MHLSTPTHSISTPSISYFTEIDKSKPILTDDSDQVLQRWSSLVGIITAIAGNILISFALNIQRLAHIKLHESRLKKKEALKVMTMGPIGESRAEENRGIGKCKVSRKFLQSTRFSRCSNLDDSQGPTYLQSPYWWGGIVLMTVGEAGNFLAYGFAPASIVSPLGVVALISNCVIAPILLKEKFRSRDFWGVVVAVSGAVTVVLSAKQDEQKLGPHEIWRAIMTLEFEVYMIITVSLIGVLMWASAKYGGNVILIDIGLVGLFGGYTALSTKGIASMLSSTLWRALTTPVTYVLLIVMIVTAVMQVKYVNRALQRFGSTQVIPVQFVSFTLSVIIGSGILYRDFEKATFESASKFFGGCLLTFFGVWLITSGRPSNQENNDLGEDVNDRASDERISLLQVDGDLGGGSSDSQGSGPDNDEIDSITNTRESSQVSFVNPASRPRSRMYSDEPEISPQIFTEESPLLNDIGKNSDRVPQARHQGVQVSSPSMIPTSGYMSPGDSVIRPVLSRPLSQEDLHSQSPIAPLGRKQGILKSQTPHSISRLIPGPLISPLSGGLSGVVVDSLRRGANASLRCESYNICGPGLRKSRSGTLDTVDSENLVDESAIFPMKENEDVSHQLSNSLEGTHRWLRIRTRSSSNALKELFRIVGQNIDTEANEETSTSGLREFI